MNNWPLLFPHIIRTLVKNFMCGPVARFRSEGGSGAQPAYERASKELSQYGRTSVRAHFWSRLLWIGPIDLDPHGFTVNRLISTQTYAWRDISRPLTITNAGQPGQSVIFYIIKKNTNFGKRRLRANTKDEFLYVRQTLPSSYATGQTKLLDLMNRLRGRVFADSTM